MVSDSCIETSGELDASIGDSEEEQRRGRRMALHNSRSQPLNRSVYFLSSDRLGLGHAPWYWRRVQER